MAFHRRQQPRLSPPRPCTHFKTSLTGSRSWKRKSSAMKALIQWIQIGNLAGKAMPYVKKAIPIGNDFWERYLANQSTDIWTKIGFAAGGAIASAGLAKYVVTGVITPEAALGYVGVASGVGSQVVPVVAHAFGAPVHKPQPEAKADVDGTEFAERIKQEQLAPSEPTDERPVNLSEDKNCIVVSWVDAEGKRRAITPTSKKPKTLAVMVSVFEAVEVVLADGRVWRKS